MPKRAEISTMQDLKDGASPISQAFKRLTPPQGPFDPAAAWQQVYHDIGALGLTRLQGQLSLAHSPGGELHIESSRNCPGGYRYYTISDLQCSNDVLATPSRWRVASKVAKGPKAPAYLNSGLTKDARFEDGTLTLRTGKHERVIKVPGPLTCKWCLLAAVGRMALQGTKAFSFSLMDEYDEPLPDQQLVCHGKQTVKTRSGSITITGYRHTGTGTVPGVFYVDASGRVLFYLAGMELLALAAANGKSTGYLT